MFRVTNILNRPRVFSLPNNETLRFLAYEVKELEDVNITDEIKKNEKQGLLRLEEIEPVEVEKKTTKKVVNKKEQEEK